jgi:ribose transport system substrate-binding protein
MTLRVRPICLVFMAVSPFLCACHPAHRRTIAVVPVTTGLELWEAAHAGAEAAAADKGYRIYWNAPTRSDDVSAQIRLVEKVIADGDAGLILAPDQYLALLAPVRHAIEKNIPVIIIKSPILEPGEMNFPSILNDEEQGGHLAATRIGEALHGSGSVAIIGFDPNILGVELRARAFEAVMTREDPHVTLYEERSESLDSNQMRQYVTDVLTSRPDVRALFALDTNTTEAAVAAVRSLPSRRHIVIVGCDQELGLMADLRNGELDSVIAEDTNRMGREAVEAIANHLPTKGPPMQVLVPPVLVTRQNIDSLDVQRILSTTWRRPG